MSDLYSGNNRVTTQENPGEPGFSPPSINLVGCATLNPNAGHWGLGGPGESGRPAAHRLPYTTPLIIPHHDSGTYAPYYPESALGCYPPDASGAHTPSSAGTSFGPSTPFSQRSAAYCDVQSPPNASVVGLSPTFGESSINAMGGSISQQLNSPQLPYPYSRDVQQGGFIQYAKQDTNAGLLLETGPGPHLENHLESPLEVLSSDPSVPLFSLQSTTPEASPGWSDAGLPFGPSAVYCSEGPPAFVGSPSGDMPYNPSVYSQAEANMAEGGVQFKDVTSFGPSPAWSPKNTARGFDAGAGTVPYPSASDPSSIGIFPQYNDQNTMARPQEIHGFRKLDPTSPKIREAADKKRIRPQKFECDICGDKLTSRQNLKNHTNSHTGKSPYSCPNCGKFYRHSRSLNRHFNAAHATPDIEQ